MIKTLKRKRDFEKIRSQGVKWNTPCFSIIYAPDFEETLFGIIASKKLLGKLAVDRNYVKRQVREIVKDAYKNKMLEENSAYLIIPKKDFYDFAFVEKQDQFAWALKHIKRQIEEKK